MMLFNFDALGRVTVQGRKSEAGTSSTHSDERELEECSCNTGLVEAARCFQMTDQILPGKIDRSYDRSVAATK